MKKIIIIPLVLSCFVFTCKKKEETKSSTTTTTTGSTVPDCSGGTPSFANAVNPLIASSCAINGCHGSSNSNGPGPLVSYTQIKNAATSIRASVLNGSMPQGSTLTNAQKSTIICWIDAGSPNN